MMNERINELELQAYVEVTRPWTDPQSNYVQEGSFKVFSRQKFAELIVQECARLNFRELGLSSSASFDISRMIKQHFGVKE